jgi:hypothetical protein
LNKIKYAGVYVGALVEEALEALERLTNWGVFLFFSFLLLVVAGSLIFVAAKSLFSLGLSFFR